MIKLIFEILYVGGLGIVLGVCAYRFSYTSSKNRTPALINYFESILVAFLLTFIFLPVLWGWNWTIPINSMVRPFFIFLVFLITSIMGNYYGSKIP